MRTRWAITFTTALLVLTVSTAFARQQTSGAGTQSTPPPPPSPVNFTDNDRQVTRQWFETHQKDPPPGLRASDSLPPAIERQFRAGLVLDPALQRQVKPVPPTLFHLLTPPPGVYKYALVGWHLVLIDDSHRVLDVIHVNHR